MDKALSVCGNNQVNILCNTVPLIKGTTVGFFNVSFDPNYEKTDLPLPPSLPLPGNYPKMKN
jgi:hypothetical protein